jgi:hypothetical protein
VCSADLKSNTACGDCRWPTARFHDSTKLEGQRGSLGNIFAANARYLYLTWNEDDGDIWVMDVDLPGDNR